MKWALGLPDERYPSPNARRHWAENARMTRYWRQNTVLACRQAGVPPLQHATVSLVFFPGDNRKRDVDNLCLALKAACDGLVDAGVCGDDDPAHMTKMMPTIVPGKGVRRWVLYVEGEPFEEPF